MITGSIKLGNKQLMITSYYRPPNKQDIEYVESTITEIQNLKSKNKNHIFLLGGDFNLPDINWKMNDVTGNQVPKAISKTFLHMSADLSIQQVNDHPTRENNILDLLSTSHPGHVERCKTLPPIGNSDHDILMVDISTNAYKPRPTRRKIFLWNKADLENMGKQLDTEFSKFNTT